MPPTPVSSMFSKIISYSEPRDCHTSWCIYGHLSPKLKEFILVHFADCG